MRITRSAPLVAGALIVLGLSRVAASGEADALLKAAGVSGGLVVHLGCGDGSLTAALRANPRIQVHGLDADPRNVAAARTRIRDAGLAGVVWVDRLEGGRLPHAGNLVNLVVASGKGQVSSEEIARVLAPRGKALIPAGSSLDTGHLTLDTRSPAGLGGWTLLTKPVPQEIDEWTHWLHGPDGNAVANDRVAGPPRRFQWIAAPLWSRSHDSVPSVTGMVSAKGRLFYVIDEAPASMAGTAPDKWALVARDAFNGLELWRRPMPEWGWRTWATRFSCRFTIPTHVPRRLVAVGDRVYATLGFNAPLTELDAATGKTVRTREGTEFTDEILCIDGTVVAAINQGPQKPGNKAGPSPEPVRKWVAAIDAASGRMRWKTGDYVGLRSKTGSMERISHLSMAAGGGRVFFVDGDRMIALSLADGREAWSVPRPSIAEHKMRYDIRISDMCTLVYHGGAVYFAQLDPDHGIDWREIRGRVHALSAATGKELGSRECSSWGWAHPADVFAVGGLIWVSGYKDDLYLGLDPKTGKVRRQVSNQKAFDNGHHHRCYRNKATARFIMTSFRGLEFIDWDSGRTNLHHWVRGTCRLGALPCNGMIYANPHPCDCYITSKLNGFLALAPSAEGRGKRDEGRAEKSVRLERGPAFASSLDTRHSTLDTSSDWPTYRRDSARSGATSVAVPMPLEAAWRVELGGEVTSPVVAGGRVVVARKDSREVVALDAASGRELWRYTADGGLDTPPTIYGERVIFGCADGRAYCLRAKDGALMWRFLAAPWERLVGAFGRLESAWPVHGSVLVQDGTAYCTAGRSSFLDGGFMAWALKAETGEAVARKRLSSDHAMPVDWGRDQTLDTGLLSDLLVAHKGGVYLRQRRIFGPGEETRLARHLHATGGLLGRSWFHRTRWFLGGVPYAEYLVFNADTVCGVRARKAIGGYGGHFKPGTAGFELFAADLVSPPLRKPARKPKPKAKTPTKRSGRPGGASQTPKVRAPKDRWCVRIPVRATAMALAADTLIVAGTPDALDPREPWAAYEGRRGGKLLAVALADGTIQSKLDLPSPPVLDGLAVAGGRLYLSAMDGSITCLGAE